MGLAPASGVALSCLSHMNTLFSHVASRAGALAEFDPILALFLGAALLAVFLSHLFQSKAAPCTATGAALVWTLYDRAARALWSGVLVMMLIGVVWLARSYLILGLVYPCVAGLDSTRQALYFDLGAVLSLALASRWMIGRLALRSPAPCALQPQAAAP